MIYLGSVGVCCKHGNNRVVPCSPSFWCMDNALAPFWSRDEEPLCWSGKGGVDWVGPCDNGRTKDGDDDQ